MHVDVCMYRGWCAMLSQNILGLDLCDRLQNELLDLKTRWDTHVKDMSRDAVTRDVELQGAQEEISRLRSELAQRKDDLLRLDYPDMAKLKTSLIVKTHASLNQVKILVLAVISYK